MVLSLVCTLNNLSEKEKKTMKEQMKVTRYSVDWKKAGFTKSELSIARPANVIDIDTCIKAIEDCQIDAWLKAIEEKAIAKSVQIEKYQNANSFNRDHMKELEQERDELTILYKAMQDEKTDTPYEHTIAHAVAYVLFPICRGSKHHTITPAGLSRCYVDARDLLKTGSLTDKSKGLQELTNNVRDAVNRFVENDKNNDMAKAFKARVNLEMTRNLCYTIIGKYNFSRSGIKASVYDEREFSKQVLLMGLEKTFKFTDIIKAKTDTHDEI